MMGFQLLVFWGSFDRSLKRVRTVRYKLSQYEEPDAWDAFGTFLECLFLTQLLP